MKKLDRFILFSFIGPFLMILVVVIFILMLHFLWLYIDELVGKGLGLKIILEFLMWGSCTILPLALPLSTLLASMMTLGQMGENNELLAMKSAGISIFRVMTPLIIASVVISIGTFFALNNLVPLSYNKIYTLRDDIGKTKEEIKVPSGTFYDGIDGYILRVEDTDDKTGKMHGVMVYDHSSNKGNTFLTLADSAQMKMSKQKDYLTFTLYHGINYQETNTKRYRDTTLQLQRIHFNRQDLVIPLKNYSFEKSDEARYGDQVKAMKLSKLRNDSDSLNKLLDSTKVMHWGALTSPTFLAKRSQLDTSVHIPGQAPRCRGQGERDRHADGDEHRELQPGRIRVQFHPRPGRCGEIQTLRPGPRLPDPLLYRGPAGRPLSPSSSSSCIGWWTFPAPNWPRTGLPPPLSEPLSRPGSWDPSAFSLPGKPLTTPPCSTPTTLAPGGVKSRASS